MGQTRLSGYGRQLATGGGGGGGGDVPSSRTINTTPPLSGGGDLSADRTLVLDYAAAIFEVTGAELSLKDGGVAFAKLPAAAARTIVGALGAGALAAQVGANRRRVAAGVWPPLPIWRASTAFYCNPTPMGVNNNFLQGTDTDQFVPFVAPCDATIDAIAINVTASVGSSAVRVGIYKDNGSGLPGDLVVDAGEFATTSNIVIENACAATLLAGEIYWVCVRRNSQAGSMQYTGQSTGSTLLGTVDQTNSGPGSVTRLITPSITYGALPATATTPTQRGTGAAPNCFLQFSSVDHGS